jgi:hypothetical protein
MEMKNFGFGKKKDTHIQTAENVKNKEIGAENIEAQIAVEAQKLEQGVTELNALLVEVGGEKGLEEKMQNQTPEKQSILKGIVERAKKLSSDLIKFAVQGGAVVGSVSGIMAGLMADSVTNDKTPGQLIAGVAIITAIGSLTYASHTILRIISESYNNEVTSENGKIDGKNWQDSKNRSDQARDNRNYQARKNSGQW